EDWRPSCCFVLPVIDLCLYLHEGYLSSRGGAFEGSTLVVVYRIVSL
ncbi:hypothetical protein A2U01_0082754, partial [Trifolium medium]|nr:hypothetical protein [Trifolium medium]